MTLSTGHILNDAKTGEPAVRITGFFASGRSFDIAEGIDLSSEAHVLIKAIRYPEGATIEAVRRRHELSALEADILARNLPGLPKDGRLMRAADAADGSPTEPMVTYVHAPGITLTEWMLRHHPDGLDAPEALRIARSIADTLDRLHEEKLVFRALAPEHVIVDHAGRPSLVGTGNIGQRQQRVHPVKPVTHEKFSAPEIQRELSGTFVTPRADIYSFGLLLAFLCTGRSPAGRQDEPLGEEVWSRLADRPLGIRLLVAHCTQPFHKKRFARLGRLLPLLHPEHLPDQRTDRFGEVYLLAPWLDAGPSQDAFTRLSPGPLVGRSKDEPQPTTAQPPHEEQPAHPHADAEQPAAVATDAIPSAARDEHAHEEARPASPAERAETPAPGPPAPPIPDPEIFRETRRARAVRIGLSAAIIVAALVMGIARLTSV